MGMEVWWGTDFHSFFYAQPLQWKYGCQGGGVGEDVSPAQLHNIENKKKVEWNIVGKSYKIGRKAVNSTVGNFRRWREWRVR